MSVFHISLFIDCSFPCDYKNEATFSLPASPQVFKDQGQILFSPASGQLRRGH